MKELANILSPGNLPPNVPCLVFMRTVIGGSGSGGSWGEGVSEKNCTANTHSPRQAAAFLACNLWVRLVFWWLIWDVVEMSETKFADMMILYARQCQ